MQYSLLVQERLDEWGQACSALAPLLTNEKSDKTNEELRLMYEETLSKHPAPGGVSYTNVDMGGVKAVLATPDNVKDDQTLLYIHGGGYVVGSPRSYYGLAGNYAILLGARVYIPDYRLAPEHPFPTPIDDTFNAYRWLLEQGIDSKSIVFSGDSAGGAMVISVMVRAKNAGLPLPAGGVAISPWCNLEHTGASMYNREGLDPQATREALVMLAKTFLNGALPNDPDASPIFADVRGLPPIMVQIGENELMLSDAIRLSEHLANNRVRVSLEVWPGMFHAWHMFSAVLPEGMQALENASTFLEQALIIAKET